MSVAVMAAVFDTSLGSSTDKLVLLALADCADGEGGSIFPSVATLARKCSLAERACQYALRRLEAAGLLVVVEAPPRRPRHYRIVLENLGGPKGAPSAPGRARRVHVAHQSEPSKGAPGAPHPSVKQLHPSDNSNHHQHAPTSSEPHDHGHVQDRQPRQDHRPDQPRPSPHRALRQARFDAFWAAFPKRASKGYGSRTEAWFLWGEIQPTARETRRMVVALRRADWPEFYGSLGEVEVNPATWLRRWRDEHRPPPDPFAVVRPWRRIWGLDAVVVANRILAKAAVA